MFAGAWLIVKGFMGPIFSGLFRVLKNPAVLAVLFALIAVWQWKKGSDLGVERDKLQSDYSALQTTMAQQSHIEQKVVTRDNIIDRVVTKYVSRNSNPVRNDSPEGGSLETDSSNCLNGNDISELQSAWAEVQAGSNEGHPSDTTGKVHNP